MNAIEKYQAHLAALAENAFSRAVPPMDAKPNTGVYFLMRGDRIHYVGASYNLRQRISAHRSNGMKFDRALAYPLRSRLWLCEAACIRRFKPWMNQRGRWRLLTKVGRRRAAAKAHIDVSDVVRPLLIAAFEQRHAK